MNSRRWRAGTRRNKRYARTHHNGIMQRSDLTNPTFREGQDDLNDWLLWQFDATAEALFITGGTPTQFEPPTSLHRTVGQLARVLAQEHQPRRGRLHL